MSRVLVLGIGNLLWADEGFGVRCVEALARDWVMPEGVELLDGGTQGLALVPDVGQCERLLVFDAIDWGDLPGTLRVVRGAEVPRFMGAKKISLHQTGFQEVLAACDLLAIGPGDDVVLVGVQAAELEDYGGSLSPAVSAQLDAALMLGVEALAAWGCAPRPRRAVDGPAPSLMAPPIGRDAYESGR